ncbi:hypothetical protein [Methylocella silvestris]|uniref:hypothetical protein n=1 Tax=Methylocella silvestris TaxID=199596 RepID=UPI0011AF4577|nr:hypothetical protein [Methylocella silvestris]
MTDVALINGDQNIPRREPPEEMRSAYREHSERIGMAIAAWNDLHANLYIVFWSIIGLHEDPRNDTFALSLWHAARSERVQRKMLLETAKLKLPKRDEYASREIPWILQQVDILSGYRNILAHTAIIFHQSPARIPKADPWSSNAKSKRFYALVAENNLWSQLSGDFWALSHYTAYFADRLWRPNKLTPSMLRPELFASPLLQKVAGLSPCSKV